MGSIRSGYPRVRRPQTARRAKTGASSGVRTHAFFRILELKSSALDHSAIEARVTGKMVRQPGFEPGSHGWEPYMITPTPQAP